MIPGKRPLFAANWKMFKGPDDAAAFAREFGALYAPRDDRSVVIFPPAISAPALMEALRERPDIEIGIQDVHLEAEGAHTGAISAYMAAQAGVGWCLAGHSERRREFGDTDGDVASKVLRILEAALRPLVCVGETIEEREAGALEEVLRRQVRIVLETVPDQRRGMLAWAYEPVWAIGTGLTASPSDAAEAHAVVRAAIAAGTERRIGEEATVVYGGSVKPSNIRSVMEAPGVDGVLVGGASLDPGSFSEICACDVE